MTDSEPKPNKLAKRRPSYFNREVVKDESFIDIQLKPVAKEKKQPQNAEKTDSQYTKVTVFCKLSQATY